MSTFWYVVMMTNWGVAMVFNPYGLYYAETDEEKAFVSITQLFITNLLSRVGGFVQRSKKLLYVSWYARQLHSHLMLR